MKKTTTERLLEAQKTEIQFQAKLKTLSLQQEKLSAYAWAVYSGLIVAATYLIIL